MQKSAQVGDIQQAIRNGGGGDRPLELLTAVMPDLGLPGNVPGRPIRINGIEMPDSFAVFRILANGKVDEITKHNGGRNNIITCPETT